MFNKKSPRKEDELDMFARALGAKSNSDAILGQEADGQRSFVTSETLPTEMSMDDRAALEAAGVVFGEVVPGDDLFQYVQLPAGWTKRSTSHSMHNDLLDDKGRKRAGIFYKAAFYDRRADLHCVRRFSLELDYDELEKGFAVVYVKDGADIKLVKTVQFEKSDEDAARKQAFDGAKDWLNSNFPDWENAAAYWD